MERAAGDLATASCSGLRCTSSQRQGNGCETPQPPTTNTTWCRLGPTWSDGLICARYAACSDRSAIAVPTQEQSSPALELGCERPLMPELPRRRTGVRKPRLVALPSSSKHWDRLLDTLQIIGVDRWPNVNTWIFGMEMPNCSRQTYDMVKTTVSSTMTPPHRMTHVIEAMSDLWRFTVATTVHAIWVERLRRMEHPSMEDESHDRLAESYMRTSLARLSRTSNAEGHDEEEGLRRTRAACIELLLRDTPVPRLQRTAAGSNTARVYLLFFDRGSRGNPGPGGSGSVLVSVDTASHTAHTTWVASMVYSSRTTTNNVAEFMGLLHGLRRAAATNSTPLHVVGDSAIILSQLRQRKPPRKKHLAALYKEARELADELAVQSWSHHYRDHNKMADRAANYAMDTRRSLQVSTPSSRPILEDIDTNFDNDVNHWIEMQHTLDPERTKSTAALKNRAIAGFQLQQRLRSMDMHLAHAHTTQE